MYITGIGMCERQKEVEEVCPCSLIVVNLPVKMDGSEMCRSLLERCCFGFVCVSVSEILKRKSHWCLSVHVSMIEACERDVLQITRGNFTEFRTLVYLRKEVI